VTAGEPGRPPFGLTVAEAVARTRSLEPVAHVYVSIRLEEALDDAARRATEAPRSPLHGVPYALKDVWETTCLPTTGGSFRHRARVPAVSGRVYRTFNDSGAVLVGKSNLSDCGLAPESSSYVGGCTSNPYDRKRTAGGSSGGAAAAVAQRMAAFDWGTDIGGSIRLPAAFCRVLGLRLSNSCWPLTEMFPPVPACLEWLCGQGPLALSIAALETVLDVAAPGLRRHPPRPFTPRGAILHQPDQGAWPSFADDVGPHLAAAVSGDIARATLPTTTRMRNIYAGLWSSHFDDLVEADKSLSLGSGLAAVLSAVVLRGRLGDRRFHPATAELLALIAAGRATIFRDRHRAVLDAHHVRDSISELWSRGYLLAMPVCAYPPPRIGRTNYNSHLLDCAFPANLADATTLAIPFGTFPGGLPRAVQLMGPPGSERSLLKIGSRLISSRDAGSALRGGGCASWRA